MSDFKIGREMCCFNPTMFWGGRGALNQQYKLDYNFDYKAILHTLVGVKENIKNLKMIPLCRMPGSWV